METMAPPTLLVLAAGMGSRYGGLKQIDPVGPHGETILDYSIYDALQAGFSKVVFVIRKEIEQPFKVAIGSRFDDRIAIDYVYQDLSVAPGLTAPVGRSKPWGTGHAVLAASNAIEVPFAVINADDWYGRESFSALSRHLQADTREYAMVGFTLRNTLSEFGSVARGLCQVDGSGLLKNIVELTHIERDGESAISMDSTGSAIHLQGDELVSMNMWGFTPGIFALLRVLFQQFLDRDGASTQAEFFIPSAVNQLIENNLASVRVLRSNESWFGFTYREDYPRVAEEIRSLVRAGYYPEGLWR